MSSKKGSPEPAKQSEKGETGGLQRGSRFLSSVYDTFHQRKDGTTTTFSITPTEDGRVLFSINKWQGNPKDAQKLSILLSIPEIAEINKVLEIFLRKAILERYDQ